MAEISLIDFENLKSKLSDFVVVDVRGKEEIIRDGQIPGSHSIPIGDIASAMDLSDIDFQTKYGFQKPSIEAPIVTHCHGGGRAHRAATAFSEKGFTNVKLMKELKTENVNDCKSNTTRKKRGKCTDAKSRESKECYKGSLKDWLENGGDVIKPGKPYES